MNSGYNSIYNTRQRFSFKHIHHGGTETRRTAKGKIIRGTAQPKEQLDLKHRGTEVTENGKNKNQFL
jgi:hypothetical protein